MLRLPLALRSRFLRNMFTALAMLACLPAFAQPAPGRPSTVYRVDTRPPEDVFVNGFSTGGTLQSVLAHTLGSACDATTPAYRSAWVSTTADREQTLQFAIQQLRENSIPQQALNGGSGIWIYAITPDNSYLHVLTILASAISLGNSAQYGFTPVHAAMLSQLIVNSPYLFREAEVVTARVRPERIFSAALVTLNAQNVPGQPLDLSRAPVRNSNYLAPASQITNAVNNLDVLVPPQSIPLYASASNQSCYMGCDGASNQRERRSLSSVSLSCPAKPKLAQILISGEE